MPTCTPYSFIFYEAYFTRPFNIKFNSVLSFAVHTSSCPLNIIIPSIGPSRWAMMTQPPVQQKGAISPWWEIASFLLQHTVEV